MPDQVRRLMSIYSSDPRVDAIRQSLEAGEMLAAQTLAEDLFNEAPFDGLSWAMRGLVWIGEEEYHSAWTALSVARRLRDRGDFELEGLDEIIDEVAAALRGEAPDPEVTLALLERAVVVDELAAREIAIRYVDHDVLRPYATIFLGLCSEGAERIQLFQYVVQQYDSLHGRFFLASSLAYADGDFTGAFEVFSRVLESYDLPRSDFDQRMDLSLKWMNLFWDISAVYEASLELLRARRDRNFILRWGRTWLQRYRWHPRMWLVLAEYCSAVGEDETVYELAEQGLLVADSVDERVSELVRGEVISHLRFQLGLYHARKGDRMQAAAHFEVALEMDPGLLTRLMDDPELGELFESVAMFEPG